MIISLTSIKLNDSQMAFRSVVNHHLGQQEAHYRLTIQVTETLFCKCYSSNFLCERLAAVPAFLGGHFFSEDVTLPQEEEGTSCYWMWRADSCRAFSACRRISCENCEYSLDFQSKRRKTLLEQTRSERTCTVSQETEREIIPGTSIPLVPRNVLMC